MHDEALHGEVLRFDNSYARLSEALFHRQSPQAVRAPELLRLNRPLAETLGLDTEAHSDAEWAEIFAGNRVLPGMEPLAMAYAGHQFGNFVPQLGDGRALLLGEVIGRDGQRRDIQLKGSGRTPYSRGGDGRAALGPVLREYVVSEAMYALGVPTTRALAAVRTGESVMRDRILPGGIVTRVARSHIRVGTFEYFAARRDQDSVRLLADHVIQRHYPDVARADNAYLELLRAVARAQAELVAQWLGVGFIHGVMNTDNVSLPGETIDYGPCAFMDSYHPDTVFSSIDQHGRYAFGNQPRIAQWNMARFAECLLPLIDDDEEQAVARATEVLEANADVLDVAWMGVMRAKLGLQQAEEGDKALVQDLLALMRDQAADYTLAFRGLAEAVGADGPEQAPALLEGFPEPQALTDWLPAWQRRLNAEAQPKDRVQAGMRARNPRYIPRNHRVEQAIAAAVDHDDLTPFHRLVDVVCDPYTERSEAEYCATPPADHERVTQTFCGT
ncbi:MAG: protein adenylyltransferase SelO [Algiphilus sp.]